MRKTLFIILSILVLTAHAHAGKIFGNSEFMGNVSVGSWTSTVAGISAVSTNGGTYTSGVQTLYYRLAGSNLLGRIPSSTNLVVSFTGASTTNAVKLSWTRYDGLASYVVEKSLDAGSTWTNWIALGPNYTNWTDLGTNSWTNSDFESSMSTIPAPSVPWGNIGEILSNSANATYQSITNLNQLQTYGHVAFGTDGLLASFGLVGSLGRDYGAIEMDNSVDGPFIWAWNRHLDIPTNFNIFANDALTKGISVAANTGYLGVNTKTPATDLDVNGSAIIRGTLNMTRNVITNATIYGNGVGITNIPAANLSGTIGMLNAAFDLGFLMFIHTNGVTNLLCTFNANSLTNLNISNIPGLGTAARSSTGDFANATQGALASSSLQPSDARTTALPGLNQISNVWIDTVGRVGINTINPSSQLEVTGGITQTGTYTNYFAGRIGAGTATPDVPLHAYLSGFGPQVKIEGSNAGRLDLYGNGIASPNMRNWAICSANSVFGGFEILSSTSSNTAPTTSRFLIDLNGNVLIGNTTGTNCLSIKQTSDTDPIADSWTTYTCNRDAKDIVESEVVKNYADELSAIPVYRWKRKPIVRDDEVIEKLKQTDAKAVISDFAKEAVDAKRDELSTVKAALPKYQAIHVGIMLDDAQIPREICANGDPNSGIDLVAWCGYLQAALRDEVLARKALEVRIKQLEGAK